MARRDRPAEEHGAAASPAASANIEKLKAIRLGMRCPMREGGADREAGERHRVSQPKRIATVTMNTFEIETCELPPASIATGLSSAISESAKKSPTASAFPREGGSSAIVARARTISGTAAAVTPPM